MAEDTIACECCPDQVPLSSGIHMCWAIAANELYYEHVEGLYIEGWAVQRRLDGRLYPFEHAWVELAIGGIHDVTPHHHCEEYFAGLRRPRGPDVASRIPTSFSFLIHGQPCASPDEVQRHRSAGEAAEEFCKNGNGHLRE